MRKFGLIWHLLITAAVGVLYFVFGELLLGVTAGVVWQPLAIALYFGLFGLAMYGVSRALCKARGDFRGWQKKNLGVVVSTAYKRAAIALVVLLIASGGFEALYELEKRDLKNASSYIFLIDDSGSMEMNDPDNKRADAIDAIMSKEKADFPFAVYRFTHEAELLRGMAPYRTGETFAFDASGGTDIVGALNKVTDDLASGAVQAGATPKVLLLSDGESDAVGLDAAIDACRQHRVVVSAISFGMHSTMLAEIAGRTGGVYTEVSDVNRLQQEMETAVTSSRGRHLLSARFVYFNDGLYAAMRIGFLLLLGLLFSWIKQKCYCCAYDHSFADKVFVTSAVLCAIAAVLTEVLFANSVGGGAFTRLLFCVLWSVTPGVFWKEVGMGEGAVGNPMASGDAYSVYDKRF